MDHNILLSKLKRYGIHETALQWIYIVTIGYRNILSLGTRLNHLHLSVPQGSILVPLFLIYINDIVISSNILSFILFADDTTVYTYVQHDSIDGAIEILNSELAKVAEWFDSNKLTLNVNKTH